MIMIIVLAITMAIVTIIVTLMGIIRIRTSGSHPANDATGPQKRIWTNFVAPSNSLFVIGVWKYFFLLLIARGVCY